MSRFCHCIGERFKTVKNMQDFLYDRLLWNLGVQYLLKHCVIPQGSRKIVVGVDNECVKM